MINIQKEAFVNNPLETVTLSEDLYEKLSNPMVQTGITQEQRIKNLAKFFGNHVKQYLFHTSSDEKTLIIPEGTTDTYDSQYKYQQITSVVMPDSLKTIDFQTFSMNRIRNANFGRSVTKIGQKAFSFNQLHEITFPDSLKFIGHGAFYKNKLTSVTIPKSVEDIGGSAFHDNPLTDVILSKELYKRISKIRVLGFNSGTHSGVSLDYWMNIGIENYHQSPIEDREFYISSTDKRKPISDVSGLENIFGFNVRYWNIDNPSEQLNGMIEDETTLETQEEIKQQTDATENADGNEINTQDFNTNANSVEEINNQLFEAEKKVQQDAIRKAKAEAEKKAQQDAIRKAKAEAEKRAKQEAIRKAKAEAEKRAKQEAIRKAKAEAEKKAQQEAIRKAKAEEAIKEARTAIFKPLRKANKALEDARSGISGSEALVQQAAQEAANILKRAEEAAKILELPDSDSRIKRIKVYHRRIQKRIDSEKRARLERQENERRWARELAAKVTKLSEIYPEIIAEIENIKELYPEVSTAKLEAMKQALKEALVRYINPESTDTLRRRGITPQSLYREALQAIKDDLPSVDKFEEKANWEARMAYTGATLN